MSESRRRAGRDTKAEIQAVALELFSTQGYEATSLREIADRLGITKAALYYHFTSKQDIVALGLAERAAEAVALRDWVDAQPDSSELLEKTIMRWVDSVSIDKLRGIRFVGANPTVMQTAASPSGKNIGIALGAVAQRLAGPSADPTRLLLVRMALLSINSAVAASAASAMTDEQVVAAARELARSIIERLNRLPSVE
jgi:AcrR family transcriptional regulator